MGKLWRTPVEVEVKVEERQACIKIESQLLSGIVAGTFPSPSGDLLGALHVPYYLRIKGSRLSRVHCGFRLV